VTKSSTLDANARWSLRRAAENAGTSIVSVSEIREMDFERYPPVAQIKLVGLAANGQKFTIGYELAA
jgi:hypothetical protein